MTIARQIKNLMRGLQSEDSKMRIFQELQELVKDEETDVKVEAIESMVDVIEFAPHAAVSKVSLCVSS